MCVRQLLRGAMDGVITTVHFDREDLEAFREIVGDRQVSARIRELVKADIDRYMREEKRAQELAGLTEA